MQRQTMHFPHKLYSTLNLQKFLHLCLLSPHSIYPLPGPGAAGVLQEEQGEEEQKLRQCHLAARVGVPAVAVSFVLVYWATGLTLYYFPHV